MKKKRKKQPRVQKLEKYLFEKNREKIYIVYCSFYVFIMKLLK